MIPTAEEIIKNAKALPKPERKKIFDWVEEEKKRETAEQKEKAEKLKADNEKFKRALKWVDENRKKYDGQFVVLEGEELIAHGKNAKELYEIARSKGIESPFIKRVKAEILPFGGW
jgi:hypothetical protein